MDETIHPCTALVASNGKGAGVVLKHTGEVFSKDVEEYGSGDLSSLRLSKAPFGLSVWEGTSQWVPGTYFNPDEGDWEHNGSFRMLTVEEIREVLFTSSGAKELPTCESIVKHEKSIISGMIIDLIMSTEVEDWSELGVQMLVDNPRFNANTVTRLGAFAPILAGFMRALRRAKT